MSVNSDKGILNFFILINSQKVENKDKSKKNLIKLALKDVGTEEEKKYSAIIVNNIKMDFSVKLIHKIMNYNKDDSSNGKNITIRPKIQRIFRNDKKRDKELPVKIHERKRSFEAEKKSKISDFKGAIKAIIMLNKMRSNSSDNKKKEAYRRNTVNLPYLPNFVEEKHEELNKDEDMLSQKYTISQNKTINDKKNNAINDKEGYRLRGHHNSFAPIKNSMTLSQIITVERNFPKKLKTIKTEEIFLPPMNYEQYLLDNKGKNKKSNQRETFCEGFFIAS